MADEVQPQTDVNPAASASEPSTETKEVASANPPASESTGGEKEPSQTVPYERFSEVISERNKEREARAQYESRLRELGSRLSKPEVPSKVTEIAKRLQERLGLKEEAAKELAESMDVLSESKRQAMEAQVHKYEVSEWRRNLQGKYKDFRDLEPAMEKMYGEMSDYERQLVVASPRGLEMLYHQARAEKTASAEREAFERGQAEAYKTRQEKKGVASQPGTKTSAPSKLTRAMIAAMPVDEYKKRAPEIQAAIDAGQLE